MSRRFLMRDSFDKPMKRLAGCMLSCAMLALLAGCTSSTPDATPVVGGHDGAGGGTDKVELPDPLALTIATWNVRNLIDNKDDGEEFETQDPGYLSHLAAVGAVLSSLDADIVMLQEVEHEAILKQLNEDELGGRYQHVRLIDANDPRGIDVAVLSKVPLDAVTSHQDDRFTKVGTNGPVYGFSRDALEVRLTYNMRPLALLNVHFKARRNDNPDKRLAEAQRTRAIADEIVTQDAQTGVLILGDFNAEPGAPAYEWVLGSQDDVYGSATEALPSSDAWSYEYQSDRRLFDHQLANNRLFMLLAEGETRVVHGPEVDAASDHAPVIARYLVQ